MRVTINPESGYYASLPAATQDFIRGKVNKAVSDPRRSVELAVTGKGILRHRQPATDIVAASRRTQGWAVMADRHAAELRNAPPWLGAGGR